MSRYDGGDKTILGQTGKFDTDNFVDILMKQPATAKFLAQRIVVPVRLGSAHPGRR